MITKTIFSLRYSSSASVPKLFNLVLDFIVRNISIVYSLVGFPEIVGEQIFKAALDLNIFWDSVNFGHDNIASAVKLFTEAYPEKFAALSLKNSLLAINNYTDAVKCLMHTATELDLSECDLGNMHDILESISECARIEKLNLSCNNLGDPGIRRMTLPMRMYKKGPMKLKVLDISGNPDITNACIKWLLVFQELHILDLSGTRVVASEVLKEHHFEPVRDYQRPEVCTSEWSKELVTNWKIICETKILQNAAKQLEKQLRTGSFYGRKTPPSSPTKERGNRNNPFQVYFRTAFEIKEKVSSSEKKRTCSSSGAHSAILAPPELLQYYQPSTSRQYSFKRKRSSTKTLFDW